MSLVIERIKANIGVSLSLFHVRPSACSKPFPELPGLQIFSNFQPSTAALSGGLPSTDSNQLHRDYETLSNPLRTACPSQDRDWPMRSSYELTHEWYFPWRPEAAKNASCGTAAS